MAAADTLNRRVPRLAAWRLGRVAAAASLALLCGSAWADPTTYTGAGTVGPVSPPTSSGSAVFLAEGEYDFTGMGSWSLLSSFIFNTVSGTGTGGFEFSQGANSFSGTIATNTAPVALGPGFEISYSITGGTGSYAGAFGGGNGLIRLLGDTTGAPPYAYIEAGIMNVSVIPEPASALLMLGGVAALLGRRMLKKG